jgi:predicted nucleic acid-binding protein
MDVVDASVAVKWVLPGEPYEENALRVKKNHILGIAHAYAPSFMVLEVGNSLWKAIKQKRITQEDAHEALRTLDDLQISLYELNWSDVSTVLTLAGKADLTIYDASYLFLSEKIQAQVITADDKMYQKAKDNFRVLHLKDYV